MVSPRAARTAFFGSPRWTLRQVTPKSSRIIGSRGVPVGPASSGTCVIQRSPRRIAGPKSVPPASARSNRAVGAIACWCTL
ncbi:hypothetical protein WKI68_10355 [Streptomyces sp. MS1.HAVA.3]|uniref:Uncharacterized protein n=1 Tax=Streptomyces caledonius TaxID=3134107 RepID=A0ABU8U1K0_9ACTN